MTVDELSEVEAEAKDASTSNVRRETVLKLVAELRKLSSAPSSLKAELDNAKAELEHVSGNRDLLKAEVERCHQLLEQHQLAAENSKSAPAEG